MTYKQALKFMLTGYVSVENSGIISVDAGEKIADYFGSSSPMTFGQAGEYFYFSTKLETAKYDIEKVKEIAGEPDIIFPYEGINVIYKLS